MYYYYCVYICMYARARRTTLRGAFRVHHTHPLQTVSLRAPPNIAAAFLFFFLYFYYSSDVAVCVCRGDVMPY